MTQFLVMGMNQGVGNKVLYTSRLQRSGIVPMRVYLVLTTREEHDAHSSAPVLYDRNCCSKLLSI